MTMPGKRLSRRRFVALAGAAVAGAPFVNLGNYRLFADSPAVYSDRAITLVNESLVMDMLSLLDMGRLFRASTEDSDPFSFSREELLAVKASGIDVFHPATGLGGPEAAVDVLTHMAGYQSSYAFRDKIDIEGLDHPRKMYDLTEGLIRRGYSDDNIGAVLGENFRRALGEIWVA